MYPPESSSCCYSPILVKFGRWCIPQTVSLQPVLTPGPAGLEPLGTSAPVFAWSPMERTNRQPSVSPAESFAGTSYERSSDLDGERTLPMSNQLHCNIRLHRVVPLDQPGCSLCLPSPLGKDLLSSKYQHNKTVLRCGGEGLMPERGVS